MRRRLEYIIPIVMFAILVQFFAPVAALRVAAIAASDPLSMAEICSGMMPSEDMQTTAPAKSKSHAGACCAVCSTIGSVAVLDPPAPVFVTLQRQFQRVAWLEATPQMAVIRVGSNTQARAPPTLS